MLFPQILGAMEPSSKEAAGKAGPRAHVTNQNVSLEEPQTPRLKTALSVLVAAGQEVCDRAVTLLYSESSHWPPHALPTVGLAATSASQSPALLATSTHVAWITSVAQSVLLFSPVGQPRLPRPSQPCPRPPPSGDEGQREQSYSLLSFPAGNSLFESLHTHTQRGKGGAERETD